MGDCLRTSEPSQCENIHPDRLSFLPAIGRYEYQPESWVATNGDGKDVALTIKRLWVQLLVGSLSSGYY